MLEELLPEEVWREPQPVLSIQGGVDWDPGIHDRLIQSLHAVSLDLASVGGGPLGSGAAGIGTANSVPFRFLSLDKSVTFPPKKPPSPHKGPYGRPLDGYAIKGLLKSSWLHKHVAQLPSAAVLVAPLDTAWSVPEWSRREQQLLQDLERLRAQLGPRDVRVFTLLLNRTTVGPQEERELEERLTALRRRLPPQYDGRLLYVLTDPGDVSPGSAPLRRLYKHVRDASSGYYFLAAKRVKRLETALSRHTQAPLIVRYRLKVAVWTEFLGGADQALKLYRRAFEALLDMNAMLHSATATAAAATVGAAGGGAVGAGGAIGGGGAGGASVPLGLGMSGSGALASGAAGAAGAYQLSAGHSLGGWLSQAKAVAELLNYKLCYYSMREARHPEAVAQFRQLLQTWCWRVVRPPRITGGSSSSSMLPPASSTPTTSLATARGAAAASSLPPPSLDAPPLRRLDFLHYEWASRQCRIFAALLQRFPAPPPGTPLPPPAPQPTLPSLPWPEAEAYVLPDHHLFNAALYLAKERTVARFLADNPRQDSKFAARVAANLGLEGPLLVAPEYAGGRPRLVDPSMEEGRLEADLNELVQLIMERDEARKPLAAGVRRLLQAAVAAHDPSRPLRQRFKGLQHLQLADELLLAQMPAEAWPHHCAALRRYNEESGNGGWHLLTAVALLSARRCALALGKRGHYLDLTLRLLGHGLRPAMAPQDRRLLFLEALYLLFGVPDFASAAMAAGGGAGEGAGQPNVFTARFPADVNAEAQGAVGPIVYDEAEGEGMGGSMMKMVVDDAPSLTLEPMLHLSPDGGGVEAALGCGANGGRQLLSFSVAFSQATAAMGGPCQLILRVVSHLPLPLRPARLLLRFNKDYLGTVTVLDVSGSSPLDRLKASLAAGAPPPPPLSAPSGYQEVDENGTTRAALLLLPDFPLDLRLTVPIPTHELVEVGDLLHALTLQLVLEPPAPSAAATALLACGARPYAKPFTLTLPSGVACLDGSLLGANVCCRVDDDSRLSHQPLVVAQPSSLPVPLHASLRGVPAVQVIRPLASATLSLAGAVWSGSTSPPVENDGAHGEGGTRAVSAVPTLVGHMHRLWLRIESHADRLGRPLLWVRSEPPPPTAAADDALFFVLGPEGRHVPLAQGRDRQPEKPLDVLALAGVRGPGGDPVPPGSTLLLPLWVRAAQEGRVKVHMALEYHSASTPPSAATGISLPQQKRRPHPPAAPSLPQEDDDLAFSNLVVSTHFAFDLDGYPPFLATFDVASPCPAPPISTPHQQQQQAGGQDVSAAAAHTLFTDEEVVMRFAVKSLSPPGWEGGDASGSSKGPQPARRPRIESVVWCPEENAPIAVGTHAQTGTKAAGSGGNGRVLYSRPAQEEKAAAATAQQQGQQQKQLQDVLSLAFHFRCPPKPSTHPLLLGRVRIHWTAPQEPPPQNSTLAFTPNSAWLSCTDVPCPSIQVVRPDVAVHLQAPLQARAGEPFPLRWTLENLLPDRPLDLRVLVAEGGGGALGVSSEEALVFAGVRESVVQLLPRRSLALSYRVAALVTGPVSLPRLVLTPLGSASGVGGDGGVGSGGLAASPAPPPLRVSYRYVDNAVAAAAAASIPQTPSGSSTGGAGGLAEQQQAAAFTPADTRHVFVLPPAASSADGGGMSQ